MRDRHLHYVGLLVFFAFSFVIHNWIFDYLIVFQRESHASFFMFGRHFLGEFLDRPGRLLSYSARFLGQFYHYKWLGALIVSSFITCFGVLFHFVLRRVRHTPCLFHTFFPCILLLALHTFHFTIQSTGGVVAACGAFLGYLSLSRRASRYTYALLATPILYFVVGGYCWFFVVWVIASEWLDAPVSSNLAFKLLYPALCVCMPLIAYRWLFMIPFRSALMSPASLFETRSFLVMTFNAYLLLMPFWARISWGARLESFLHSKTGTTVRLALLIVLAVSLLYVLFDPQAKDFAHYHQLYKRGQWDAILTKAKRNPSRQLMTQFFTHYALYQKGKLLEEMFNYPNTRGTRGLVLNFFRRAGYTPAQGDLPGAMYNSDLFFEMSYINAAFRHAFNHMVLLGKTYENVKRIVECNIVNGNYRIAEKYLNMLEKTLFYKKFARRHKSLIADANAADRYFAESRTQLPNVELDMYISKFVPMLAAVKGNPQNRMAFDYLMAWCLLDKVSIPMVAENIRYLREAGYTSIPTHLQENLKPRLAARTCITTSLLLRRAAGTAMPSFTGAWATCFTLGGTSTRRLPSIVWQWG